MRPHTCNLLTFTCKIVVLFVACLFTPKVALVAEKPNVLFIAVDDLGNVLGKARPNGLRTPHIDALKKRGVFFERAYCQIPLCNPSRASVMTGRRPDATDVFDLDRHFRESLPDVVTVSQLFRKNGYVSSRVGKIYHYNVPAGIGTNGLDDAPSWDHVVNPLGRDVREEAKITNPTPHKKISAAMSWLAADGADEEQTDGMIATEAIALMKKYHNRPFFLGVGFFRPHTPYVAPRKYFEQYPLDSIKLVDVPEGDRDDIPAAAIPHNIPLPNYGLDKLTLKKSLQAYMASVSFIDAQVGRVINALDKSGLAQKTIIVFWSDHGYHLGEHGLWQKRTLFEESARSPLMICPAGNVASDYQGVGKTCNEVVEFIDIYPTVAELAGLTPPNNLDGKSLRPLIENPNRDWRGIAFTQILRPGDAIPIMGRSITTKRFRYIEWDSGKRGKELYDLKNDPREINNLAEEILHYPTVEQLGRILQEHVSGDVPTKPFNKKRL